jgi:hypothetical protein
MPPKSQDADDKRQAAREVIDILQEISDLLVRVLPLGATNGIEPLMRKDHVLTHTRIHISIERSCPFVCLLLRMG